MRQFNFKEWVFKNLFPFYYQENDTYHDSSGKGILQRFTEVCSEYFDTDILADSNDSPAYPGLDNIVNLIDVDTTPDLFLNYLWEFLGEIPYAYGVIMGATYTKEDFKKYIDEDFPAKDARDLLKYAVSLYKIRGTDKFYDVLGRYYGFRLELIETKDGGQPGYEEDEPNHDHLVLATYQGASDLTIATYGLGSQEIRAPYPDGDCTSCLYFAMKVGINPTRLQELIDTGRLDAVMALLQGIVEKYLPIHCLIAHYDNGDPKILIRSLGDFLSEDFGPPNDPDHQDFLVSEWY